MPSFLVRSVSLLWLCALAACAGGLEPGLQTLVMSSQDDSTAARAGGPEQVPAWAGAAPADTNALSQVVLMLPLEDGTRYLKRFVLWPVHSGVPRVLGDSLATNPFYRVLPVDSAAVLLTEEEQIGKISTERALAIGRFLSADWVVFGRIDGLAMNKFTATAPIGGHRSYKGLSSVHLVLYNVVDGRRGPDIVVEEEVDSKRTGIANPASHVHLDKQYFYLHQLVWGTEEFDQSLVGQALSACAVGVAAQSAEVIKPPQMSGVSEPKIIDVDGTSAYINVGLVDGIQNGDKFGVWDLGRELRDPGTGQSLGHALPRRIGVVQVEQVLSDHLALVRILDGRTTIAKGYSIRPE